MMNRIKQLRKARGLRQADVARETCIDQKTLSNYETGRTNPDSYAIVQMADFFGVTADYLLGLSDYNLKDVDALLTEVKETQAKLQMIEKILVAEKKLDK
ncbi:MAG: helix-turn-helix domain-containing protein [Clostridia bacterium]|nr:helix-turn-helix domain-containing protein [Clostridia bacterium]